MSEPADQLSHRARAMLRAVAEGRAHLASGTEPDLYIDGVPCCDQFTAHLLTHDGLITATHGRFGELVPATITEAGATALGAAVLAA
ncbi:hypothetical protein [Actinokineospora globicatena]|uniref:Uncharacterized protein n=1 Tax=Actinokineospora globicatena TaxID=103729 RepID=A0A9W6V6A6_9PSEU|nr:hypothetical protein [Actinokineospora globicatena]MCP2302738.1 hypothetical protein [Actinokineospora globicatena]GLW75572.1 hypothetical protein Aglo01_00540 [Actinokineospora globicatena]GLW82412.1 hypothetical protein Aglo02_00530 [Actinokineospora globicatena]GLW91355.1 hypothetical protein Aglo03_21710 [Actinokineospora globicatena]